jgi:hypothetical protein
MKKTIKGKGRNPNDSNQDPIFKNYLLQFKGSVIDSKEIIWKPY